MDKVYLYLLGAGASSQTLPLASQFASRLTSFAGDLLNDTPNNNSKIALNEAIDWLAKEASHHFSVDTFAKKLYFRGDIQNLKKLKAALSAYLVIEQSRHHVDRRYDAFLASVLKFDSSRRVSLPEHLRILTWNYDTQLEKAYYGFCDDYDKVIEGITFNKRIYRINGCCGTHPPGHVGESFRAAFNIAEEPAWNAGMELYNQYMTKHSSPAPDINFAWEDSTHNQLNNVGLNLLSDVTDLIVIGYSFPYFNREIDDIIFKQFDNLFRVYLQFPDGVHATIEERIKKLLPDDVAINRVVSTDLFYIPDDF